MAPKSEKTPTSTIPAVSPDAAAAVAAAVPNRPIVELVAKVDNPEDEAARRRAAPAMASLDPEILAVLESFGRKVRKHESDGDLVGTIATMRETADELDRLVKGGAGPAPVVPPNSVETVIVVPGEGSFIVFVNEHKKVALRAVAAISGTGIMPGNFFGEDPVTAVRLVVAGGAVPAHPGGVRRTKAGPPAGETSAAA